MSRTVIPMLAVGWVGSVASWLAAAHPILSLLATVLAAVASIYAIVVARRTARLRRLEIEAATQRLCDPCRTGQYTPSSCSLKPRPTECPLNHRKP